LIAIYLIKFERRGVLKYGMTRYLSERLNQHANTMAEIPIVLRVKLVASSIQAGTIEGRIGLALRDIRRVGEWLNNDGAEQRAMDTFDKVVADVAVGSYPHRSQSSLVRQCKLCAYEWVKHKEKPEPARCPNKACRSRFWNRGRPAAGSRGHKIVEEIPSR
jgi:hypothetical protein